MLSSIGDFKNTLNYFAPVTDDDATKKVTVINTNSSTVFICSIYCFNDGICNFVSLDTGALVKSCNTSSPVASCIGNNINTPSSHYSYYNYYYY